MLALCLTVISMVISAAQATSLVGDIVRVPLFEVGNLWLTACNEMINLITYPFTTHLDLLSPWTYLVLFVYLLIFYGCYKVLWAPYNRIRKLGDIGYVPEGNSNMREMANIVRNRRKIGNLPPVYPNGWFSIMESRDLELGQVKQVNCLGLTLAVFRGEDGTSHAIDAYCPHLGANLAVGGQVKGGCLECPFHGWQFNGNTGKCIHIPYLDGKIPDIAKVKSYTTLEKNEFIYVWHHAEGAEPTWIPQEIEEITRLEWVYRGRTEHIVNCHIEEVPENGADISHLPQVHGPFMTSGIDLRYIWSRMWEFAKHNWEGKWTQDADEKHIGCLNLVHSAKIFGIHLPMLDMRVKAKQIGPGIVYLFFEGFLGRGVYLHHVTPMEPLLQKVIHQVYIPWYLPPIVGKFYMISEAIQIERDIMIWNNKQYEGKPIFVKSMEDQLLAKHRRWYSQFYSENSPRFTFRKDTVDF